MLEKEEILYLLREWDKVREQSNYALFAEAIRWCISDLKILAEMQGIEITEQEIRTHD